MRSQKIMITDNKIYEISVQLLNKFNFTKV